MKRAFLFSSSLLTFALGLGSAASLISSSPAFNEEHRRENVFGQEILAVNEDMYDRSRYLMQQGASYIRADLLDYDGQVDVVAPVEVAIERGNVAVDLMRESLLLNPGNARGWLVRAWAHMYSGDRSSAEQALKASWQLAPFNRSLAIERLDMSIALYDPLVDVLDETVPIGTETDLDKEVKDAILRDLETLRRLSPILHEEFVEDFDMTGIDLAS